MKTISILFLILTTLILALSIYTDNYNGLMLAFLSGLMSCATWPEKKNPEKPFRNHRTWKDEEK